MWEETGRALIPQAIIAHKKFKEAGVVAEIGSTALQASAVLPRLQRDKMPLFVESPLSPICASKPQWIFGADCGYGSQFATAVKWFNKKWTEPRPLRVGLFIWDSPEARAVIEAGIALSAIKQMGVDFVGYEVVPVMGTLDTSTEWLRLVNKGADVICSMGVYGSSQMTLIKDSARLGIQEKGIKLIGSLAFCDVYSLQVVGKALNGWYGLVPIAHEAVETEPGLKPLAKVAAEKRGWMTPEEISSNYVLGWLTSMLVCEGVRLAMEKVGYENLTGRTVREGIVSVKDFDPEVGIPPISLTDSRPYWNVGNYVEQVQQGKFVKIGDWIESVYNLDFTELAG